MKCQKCGAENPGDSLYCERCGTRLADSAAFQASQTAVEAVAFKPVDPGLAAGATRKASRVSGKGKRAAGYKKLQDNSDSLSESGTKSRQPDAASSVFANGLPEWDLIPPDSMIMRGGWQ